MKSKSMSDCSRCLNSKKQSMHNDTTPVEMEEVQPEVNSNVYIDVHTSGSNFKEESASDNHGTFSSSSKFDSIDGTSELDELLQTGHLRGGILGLVERLPLCVKLFLMLVIALAGLLAFGLVVLVYEIQSLKYANATKDLITVTVRNTRLIHYLQEERSIATQYLFSQNMSEIAGVSKQTDQEVEYYIQAVERTPLYLQSSTLSKQYYRSFLSEINKLNSFRENITNTGEIERVTLFYDTLIGSLVGQLKSGSVVLNDYSSKNRDIQSLNYLVLLKEGASSNRDKGTLVLLNNQFNSVREYILFAVAVSEELTYKELLTSVFSESINDTYTDIVAPTDRSLENMYNLVVSRFGQPLNIDLSLWDSITSARITGMKQLEDQLERNILVDARNEFQESVTKVTVIIVLIVVVWIAALVFSVLFSFTVTGPWKRLIVMQEATVQKFVPKGFLRLLRCYNLSELQLGQSVERDLTILKVEMTNFNVLTEKMTHTQTFSLLNNYLARIGPIVRKYGGYVDKFMGQRVMACFPNFNSGLSCSLEMQESITQMNKQNDTCIKVAMSVNSGRVMVGAIGDSERYEGTIISETVDIASRLQNLAKVFGAAILTTQDAYRRLKSTQSLYARPLGYVRVGGKKQNVKLYELLDKSDSMKVDTRDQFKKAVDYMTQHRFDSAVEIFEEIVTKSPNDIAAERLLSSCKQYAATIREDIKAMQVGTALKFESIRQGFEQYSKTEVSLENYELWKEIQSYKQAGSDWEKVQVIRRIFRDYLSDEAKHKFNTSANTVEDIRRSVIEFDTAMTPPSPDIIASLEVEVELLMNDTFARYKRAPSDQFMKDYGKHLPAPLIHILDEDIIE